jgi:hypothetical protein
MNVNITLLTTTTRPTRERSGLIEAGACGDPGEEDICLDASKLVPKRDKRARIQRWRKGAMGENAPSHDVGG